MAVLARAMVTLASIKDVASTTRYYKLLSSTNTWSTTEPTYSSTSTNTLYFVDLTVFSDGDFDYSEVSKSTSYEAAKSAYNIAKNAKDVADSAQESIDNLEIGGRNLGLYSKTLSASPSKDNRYFSWRGTGNTQIRTDGFTEQVSTQNWWGIRIYANSLDLKVSDTVTFSCNVRNDSSIQNRIYFYCMAFDSSGNRDTTSKFLHVKAENINADGQGGIVTNIEPNSEKRIWVTLTWLQLAEDLVNADGSIEFSFQSWSTDWTAGSMSYYAPKIEKGNVMTDWSPAPEDLDIDSLGGRNILLDGNFTNGFDKWSFNYSSGASMPEIVTEDGIKCCHYQGEIGKASQVRQNILDRIANDEVGQQYTVSFDIKLVNYTSGTTNPFLQVYFSGTYDDNGTQKYMGATWGKEHPNLVPYNNKGWIHVIVSNLYFAYKPINEMWFMIYSRDWSGDLYFTNLKLERGNKATDWTPAPEDIEESVATVSNTLTDYINSTEIIVGTQTAATGSWTGVAGFSELRDGQQIAYWLPYAGSGNASLNLTLSDGTTTGAKTVYYKGSTVATTHFSAGTVIHLTYRVNANVNGTAYTGWWADASYDSGNTYNRIRFENAIFAKSAISASRFIVGDDSGFSHLVGGSVFDITKPILWATNAIGSGKTATTNYLAINGATLRNNSTGITLTQYKTCYLVGTLSGRMFTTNLTNFFTSTIPTSDDGYYYIALGYLYSTYQIYLYPEHPIYKFVDGEFKNLNQVAYEASVLASEAKDDIENLEVGGRNLLLNSDKDTYVTTTASTNGGTVTTSYFDVSDYGKNFTSSTETVFTISAWYEFSGNAIDSDTRIYVQFNGTAIATANVVGYSDRVEEIMTSKTQSGIYRRSFRLTEEQASSEPKRIRMVMRGAPNGAIDTLKITKIKLELGNRATDWTQAPEDIIDSIEGISIGGRNLLLDSEKETVSPAYANTTVYTPYYYVSDYGKPFVSEEGTLLTLSCEYEVTGTESNDIIFYGQLNNNAIARVSNYGTSCNEQITSNNYTGVYRRSFTVNAEQATNAEKMVRFGLSRATTGTVLKIRKIKLELGNRATDWTPAPEDIEYAMNNVSIESSADSFINYTFNGNRSYYPTSITLTPFINGNISFSKWQYHPINDTTWVDVSSGTHGITVSANNELVIANSSDLFTDTCSAIIFKCVSDNESYYSLKTVAREDDPTRVYNTVKTRIDQTDTNLSLIASSTELAEYSTSSTLNTKLSNVSLSSDEILMVVSQSVNNTTGADGIKGVYSETTTYAKNNIVVLDGKFYKAKSASTGKTPPNTTYWTDVSSNFSESVIKSAFSQIVALQDSITLTVSGTSGSSSTLNLGNGTLSMSVTDVATILANKELNLLSDTGVINITGGGGVNIGTSSVGAITINSPHFVLNKDGSLRILNNYLEADSYASPQWKSGVEYNVDDIVYSSEDIGGGVYAETAYICISNHTSSSSNKPPADYEGGTWDSSEFQNYWNYYVVDDGDNTTIEVITYYGTIEYATCGIDINSSEACIELYDEHVTEGITLKNYYQLKPTGIYMINGSSGREKIINKDGYFYKIGNTTLGSYDFENIYSLNALNITSDSNLNINGANVYINNYDIGSTSISSIGDGSITGAIANLKSNKANLLTSKLYRTDNNSIGASSYKDITYNVALSGYTALGVVGARAEGNSNVALFGFYLESNTAYARVKNLTTSAQSVKVAFTVLYVKNS